MNRNGSERGRDSCSKENDRRRKRSSEDQPCASRGREKVLKSSENVPAKGRTRREIFIDQLVSRPAYLTEKSRPSSTDTNVNLVSNYFRVNTKDEFTIFSYRVDFKPESENARLKKFLLSQHRKVFGTFIYDGGSIILMPKLLESPKVLISTSRDGEFVMTFRNTGKINFTSGQFLQALNLIQRDAMRGLDLTMIKRNFYDSKAIKIVPGYRLSVWPGYDTSIRQHDDGLLINCDLTSKVFRSDTVHDTIRGLTRSGGDYKINVERAVVGMTVMTEYNNATYRVDGVNWDINPASTFETKDGPVSFCSYYKSKFGLSIKDERQPLLISKASARNIRAGQTSDICLVPEFCRITGLTDTERTDFKVMRALAQATAQDPLSRVKRLLDFSKRLGGNARSIQSYQDNGMTMEKQLVTLRGRRMKQEVIFLGNETEVDLANRDNADWTKSLQSNKMFVSVLSAKLKNWFFVYPKRLERSAQLFWNTFSGPANRLDGNRITNPIWKALNGDTNRDYVQGLNEVMSKDPSFIMVLVPNDKADRYEAIKKTTLCSSRVVPTQVINDRKTVSNNKDLLSIATKVAIQVNCKLGGIPWFVDFRLAGIMIVGYDVCRDSVDKSRSYGAMVASLNPQNRGGRYYSSVSQEANGVNMYTALGISIFAAIDAYQQCNEGALPKRILIYRDGVGDGDVG